MTERAAVVAVHHGSRVRLALAILAGVCAWLLASLTATTWLTRILIGADVGGVALLAVALSTILRADEAGTRARAAADDPGRTFVWLLVLLVSALMLFATTFVLHEAKSLPTAERLLVLILTVLAASVSWWLTHVVFTLRYAHLYYREGRDKEGGIQFPSDDDDADDAPAPDDLDFMYFAFTIGMTFQVSDAQITSRIIRRTALFHALISFGFNTGIVALVLNVVMGQLQ